MTTGSGEPVLLISPVIADGFLPLVSEPALADRFRLICPDNRGFGWSSPPPDGDMRKAPSRRGGGRGA